MKWYRDPFAVSAGALAAVAFAGSFDHTHQTVVDFGQGGWVAVATALAPEISVGLSVLRIRRGGLSLQVRWAWVVLVTNAAFTLWGNLEQAKGVDIMPETAGALIVGGWLAWSAIGAAGFIEIRPKEEPSTSRASGEQRTRTRAPRVTTTLPGSASGTSTASGSLALVGGPAVVPSSGTGRLSCEQVMEVALRMREGDKWPSRRALMTATGCARGTADKAITRLQEQEVAA